MSARRERAASGLLSALITGAIGWALVLGLGVDVRRTAEGALLAFDVAPPPPERERIARAPVRHSRPEGRAAPPNLRADPTPVTAPTPMVVPPVPSPVVAAPVARTGADATAGAADRAGPGRGAGGEGDGFGGGGRGDGDGGGGEEGPEQPPVPRNGRLSMAVLPPYLRERNGEYSVELRYHVEADGRATGCRAVRGSGWPELDANACRGVELRFRYRPALDGAGRPVRSVVMGTHSWLVEGEPDARPRR